MHVRKFQEDAMKDYKTPKMSEEKIVIDANIAYDIDENSTTGDNVIVDND